MIAPKKKLSEKYGLPENVEDWRLSTIEKLILSKANENAYFDYKEDLPPAKNREANKHLREIFLAFANSSGGYLIYGVRDNPASPSDIIGISDSSKFLERIQNLLNDCEPHLDWRPSPPLLAESGNLVYVLQINSTENLHYSKQENREHAGFVFPYRNQGGGMGKMTYPMIKDFFLNQRNTQETPEERARRERKMKYVESSIISVRTFAKKEDKDVQTAIGTLQGPLSFNIGMEMHYKSAGIDMTQFISATSEIGLYLNTSPRVINLIGKLNEKCSEINQGMKIVSPGVFSMDLNSFLRRKRKLDFIIQCADALLAEVRLQNPIG